MISSDLKNNEKAILNRIKVACDHSNRAVDSVKLIWVSKTKPIEDVDAAYALGAKDFGENKVQESIEKFSVRRPGADLHLIGPLQSNKMRKIAQIAQWIHTMTSVKSLDKLDRICAEENVKLRVLIQINTSKETTKSGVAMEEAEEFLEKLPNYANLLYCGLMTIGINTGVAEDSRECFSFLRNLKEKFYNKDERFNKFTELSMGMTGDLEIAVEEGATMVRIGTALFGARNYQ